MVPLANVVINVILIHVDAAHYVNAVLAFVALYATVVHVLVAQEQYFAILHADPHVDLHVLLQGELFAIHLVTSIVKCEII